MPKKMSIGRVTEKKRVKAQRFLAKSLNMTEEEFKEWSRKVSKKIINDMNRGEKAAIKNRAKKTKNA